MKKVRLMPLLTIAALFLFCITAKSYAAAGESLYNQYCSACHGNGSNSNKKGATASKIQNAISANTGGMGSLSFLSSSDINAIASYLQPAASSTSGGAAGSFSITYPNNASLQFSPFYNGQNHKAIVLFNNNQPEIGEIAVSTNGLTQQFFYLFGTSLYGSNNGNSWNPISSTGGSTGSSSFTCFFSSCYFNGSNGSTGGGSASGGTGSGGSTGGSASGQSLYAQYCASCHGSGSSSNKAGATASRIQNAISSNTGGMASLSFLTSSQINSIASYLQSVPGGGGSGGDGDGDNDHDSGGGHDDSVNHSESYNDNNSLMFETSNSTGTDNNHNGINDVNEGFAVYPNSVSTKVYPYYDGANHGIVIYYNDNTASAIAFSPDGSVLGNYYLSNDNKLYYSQDGTNWSQIQ